MLLLLPTAASINCGFNAERVKTNYQVNKKAFHKGKKSTVKKINLGSNSTIMKEVNKKQTTKIIILCVLEKVAKTNIYDGQVQPHRHN